MTDELGRHEREKYAEVWRHDDYRVTSPGDREKERAWDAMGCQPGESLIDYGSGTGRATLWFAKKGLNAVGVDHVAAANESAPIVFEACLWSLPSALQPSDYTFCCDVMEHIPPERVDAVLDQIARRTKKGGWFRIATRPDGFGPKLLGEPLHLTVQPASWWEKKLGQWFENVELVQETAAVCVFSVGAGSTSDPGRPR